MSQTIALPAAAAQNLVATQSATNAQGGSGPVQATSSSSTEDTATAGQTFESVLKGMVKQAEETSSGNTPAESPAPEASSSSQIAAMTTAEAVFSTNTADVASAILPLLAQLAALTSADRGSVATPTSPVGSVSLPGSLPQPLTASGNELRGTKGGKSLLEGTGFTATIAADTNPVVAGAASAAATASVSPVITGSAIESINASLSSAINRPLTPSVTDPASAAVTASASSAVAGPANAAVKASLAPAITEALTPSVTDPASAAVTASVSPAVAGPASAAATASMSSAVTRSLSPTVTAPARPVATGAANQADASSDVSVVTTIRPNESTKPFASAIATAISAEIDGTAKSSETGKALIEATPPTGQAAIQNLTSGNMSPLAHASRANSSVAVPVDTPFNQPGWSNEVGDKLTWMVTSQRQQAELVLNPPQLGRIDVSLTVTGDQATATFASPNAAVREMLENSLPRLREILAGAGINLGESQVGAESQSRFAGETGDNRRSGRQSVEALAATDALQLLATAPTTTRTGRGLVDIFA